ncbi:hypothetical protein KKD04_00645 [Patescibacteria group bacterium]|nr:hypothetical protein [Patescibacteria group bacterium]
MKKGKERFTNRVYYREYDKKIVGNIDEKGLRELTEYEIGKYVCDLQKLTDVLMENRRLSRILDIIFLIIITILIFVR